MSLFSLRKAVAALSVVFLFHPVFSQTAGMSDQAINQSLQDYIDQKITKDSQDMIPRERFLIQQMRLINAEIKSRVKNIGEIRKQYFDGLQGRLQELRSLKDRLGNNGSTSLKSFINDLENRIEATIDEGKIDYRRQKVFEDGLQLLYIAEEMVNHDPGARVEENPALKSQLQKSREKFSATFGTKTASSEPTVTSRPAKQATVFDIYKEWKKTNSIKYEVRWTDVQILKKRLLRNGSFSEKDRMFKRELASAAESFNFEEFDLAERLFSEILTRYDFISAKDDILFYQAECNFLLGRFYKAKDTFSRLVEEYPTSEFSARAYARLLHIANEMKDYANVISYFRSYEKLAQLNDPEFSEVQFETAIAALNNGDFEMAVSLFTQVPNNSEFYYDARFFLGQAYAGANNLDDAERVFTDLMRNQVLPPEYQFNILLRLGYIKYEKAEYAEAIRLLDQISPRFAQFDRVLITYGWAYYKQELAKEDHDTWDFSKAKIYLKELVDRQYDSDYVLEGKSLLGYILQLEENPEFAIDQYEYVFRSRYTKKYSDDVIAERDSLKKRIEITDQLTSKALARDNKAAFIKAQKLHSRLNDTYRKLSFSDLSTSSSSARQEIIHVRKQVDELNALEQQASEQGKDKVLKKIQDLRYRLVRVLNSFPLEDMNSSLGQNYFDEHPSARKASVVEEHNAKILAMRESAHTERLKIDSKLAEIRTEIAKAKTAKNYRALMGLEIQQGRFEEIAKRFDFLDSYANRLAMKETNIDLRRWSDYGAFGIANANFALKKTKARRIAEYTDQIQKINQIFVSRKSILEHKIGMIEGEINLMTRRVREQERMREREELDRKFKESYFDTHSSESDTDTTQPPVLNEDQQNDEL